MTLTDISIPQGFSGQLGNQATSILDTPGELIGLLLPNLLILAGVIFFGLILGGGFMMIAGAGKEENAQDKAKAQGAITYGVIGFLLVISAYFILQIIGTVTGINFISPTPIP